MLAGIDDLILDRTASHPSSIFLVSQPASPCRLKFRAPCDDDYGGLVLRLQWPSFV